MTTASTVKAADERVRSIGLVRRLLLKPELGAVIGAVVIFVFFSLLSEVFRSPSGVANWLDPAATIGIMAVPVALLMIGGHFDLSAGVAIGTAGITTTILTTQYNMVLWVAMAVSLLVCLGIGFLNGYLVVRTGLPSFIITLSTFLGLQGLNVGVTKLITDQVQVQGLADEPFYDGAHAVFAGTISIGGQDFQIAILWWILITALGSWVLLRTRFGNWVFAIGGDLGASRNVGVPAARTTITLFMAVSAAAWFVGNTQAIRLGSIQAVAGFGQELIFIVAAVIGGCLLTGGFGSVIGASVGALIFGMTSQGIVYAGWDSDWFKFFLGAMLLLAVLANRFVRRYAEESGK
ncbi:simple sugar transport system permease protein [Thermocatellispora tengchongensis]|uniref:Xylose transport system permease protein XylH n=1 Tax=Thermocatellispora tengchongensis TaxID=1073253 RepID=A0A840PME0_9ACTN|nr:ABC transporter permease [Thermocatellispora tengchongensis]MBB5139173.1 simple sugar transport system permease protein [Thermocatellispora tengchongensis]